MARLALVVTSDRVYRGEREDEVTPLVRRTIEGQGHTLAYATIVPNDERAIEEAVREACRRAKIVLVTGGTGISPRDKSVDVLERLADRRVPGFGEAHRRLSWEKVGEKAILSRASAYVVNGCFVAVSPGSPDAVSVALRLLLPVASHIEEQLEGRPHK